MTRRVMNVNLLSLYNRKEIFMKKLLSLATAVVFALVTVSAIAAPSKKSESPQAQTSKGKKSDGVKAQKVADKKKKGKKGKK